jgi:hypothetical protein
MTDYLALLKGVLREDDGVGVASVSSVSALNRHISDDRGLPNLPEGIGMASVSSVSALNRHISEREAVLSRVLAVTSPRYELPRFVIEKAPHRYLEIRRDLQRFVLAWGRKALDLGWTEDELFGCHPVVPMARYDCMGLVFLIGGGEVTHMDAEIAYLRTPSGGNLRHWRRKNPPYEALTKLTEGWIAVFSSDHSSSMPDEVTDRTDRRVTPVEAA